MDFELSEFFDYEILHEKVRLEYIELRQQRNTDKNKLTLLETSKAIHLNISAVSRWVRGQYHFRPEVLARMMQHIQLEKGNEEK